MDTELKSRLDKIDKYNEFRNIWAKNFDKIIADLITFGKISHIQLSIMKADIRNTMETILNQYHEKERFHTLLEKK